MTSFFRVVSVFVRADSVALCASFTPEVAVRRKLPGRFNQSNVYLFTT